ncbi:hypothetical protein ACFHYQ_25495 [Sphaerimonospora cavernae]|uniref:Uncharacterized protein n=1 Tax=Sphaerimonospora cavernae TaxID=1740611 RepID=A0ABV6UBT5_9ACTN
MNVIYTVLFAFTIGFFIRGRSTAVALYLAGEALVFVYQSVNLLIEWVDGSDAAFGGPFPKYDPAGLAGYGVVNLVITIVGIGLAILGARIGAKRAARRDVVSVG